MVSVTTNGNPAGKPIRRRFSRIGEKVALQYRVRENDARSGADAGEPMSINIGGGGLLFGIEEPVAISAVMDIEINLPVSPIPMSVVARVVRVEEIDAGNRYDVGVEFLEICDEDKRALEEFIRDRLTIDIRFEDTKSDESASIVRLDGYLDSGTVSMFESAISALSSEGRNRIVLDCRKLNYINSDGIMVLLSTSNDLKKMDGGLKLFGVSEEMSAILELVEAGRFLDIFDSEKEALAAFRTAS